MVLSRLVSFQLPTIGPIAPPPGGCGLPIACLQLFLVVASYSQETTSPTEYSKFANGKQLLDPIPSRIGMLRIYVPSVLAAAGSMVYQILYDQWSLATPLLLLHFLKRCLEVAFLHHYSGSMPKASADQIGIYYAMVTLLVSLTATTRSHIESDFLHGIGLALFGLGELGNFYHHCVLRSLRKNDKNADRKKVTANSTKQQQHNYVAPTGGFFRFVATPHYLFELIAWLGVACVAQQLHAFLVVASTASYLAGRAVMTNRLYSQRFNEKEWPRTRKALVPGIF